MITTFTYGSSTTAGESTAGNVAGYLYQTHIQRGETGTAILQSQQQYFKHTANSFDTHPVANVTRYRNTDGTGGQTTSFSYTYFSSSHQIESVTTTLPTVTTAQNGPNSADVSYQERLRESAHAKTTPFRCIHRQQTKAENGRKVITRQNRAISLHLAANRLSS